MAAWRSFFLSEAAAQTTTTAQAAGGLPGLVETAWLDENLRRSDLRVIDVRPQPAYTAVMFPEGFPLR